ncbi:MAG: serine hydrolase domain-containing protein, partial [Acidimicrobiia bacterium]
MRASPESHALARVDNWPAETPAVGVTRAGGVLDTRGPVDQRSTLASVTKLLTTLAVLVAVEEGTLNLEDPGGPVGSSVAHLLAHASGLGAEGGIVRPPGERRIYSNAGFELLGEILEERHGIPYETYVSEAVLQPLGMTSTTAKGSPASGALGTVNDLLALGRELLNPTLVSASTLGRATSPAFPGLAGVLPGFGPRAPNDWGLGFELRDGKSPHWTGSSNSPSTFGHFGRSGSFLW